MYSLSESALDHLQVEQYMGGHSATNPVLAGAFTGLVYKSTAAPRTAALASVLGGMGAGMFCMLKNQVEKSFGR